MADTYYNCLYPTASSAKGLEICSPSVGFFKYFKPEIDEEICFLDVAVLLSRVPRSPESASHLSFFLADFSNRNVRFSEATNAKHRVVSHELMTFCGSCSL